ncbi:ATP-binding protein [Flavobacterium sp. B17]|nr:ATP-binding protein [Flavobacterium sp. B17]
MGIGLFICSEIIKQHHGNIGVSSKVDEGSTFYFTLPLN